jgi:hypothetical protein
MNAKHTKILQAIFAKPTASSVREGDGSRVALHLGNFVKHAHRPHPGKEAKKYQIEEIRLWLEAQGIRP